MNKNLLIKASLVMVLLAVFLGYSQYIQWTRKPFKVGNSKQSLVKSQYNVQPQANQKLQFLPELGVVKEQKNPQTRYILKNPITTKLKGGMIVITGMVVDDQMTYISMSGVNTLRPSKLKVIRKGGKQYSVQSADAVESDSKWTGTYWYNGKLNLKGHCKIILGKGNEILVNLIKAKNFNSYKDMGPTAKNNGISITAFTTKFDGKGRVSLVSYHPNQYQILNYGINYIENKSLTVTDDKGKQYNTNHYMGDRNPQRSFNFKLTPGVKSYTIKIPEILVVYHDSVHLIFNIPPKGETDIHKKFKIAGFPVVITKIERIQSNQLRVYFNLNHDQQAPKSLYNFGLAKRSSTINKKFKYLQFQTNLQAKQVHITITEPEVTIRGPWILKIPAKKYFQ